MKSPADSPARGDSKYHPIRPEDEEDEHDVMTGGSVDLHLPQLGRTSGGYGQVGLTEDHDNDIDDDEQYRHHHTGDDDSFDSPQDHSKNSGGIFRDPTTSSAASSAQNSRESTPNNASPINPNIHHSGGMSGLRSRSASWEDMAAAALFEGDDSDDDNDMDADVMVMQRYSNVRNRIPIVPAEFSHRPIHKRLWQGLMELRTAARQRRAARLLNLGQHPRDQYRHCILTWCCDATDRGIAVVAIGVVLWILIGSTHTMFQGYWFLGMVLFVIRVSARRIYESVVNKRRSRVMRNNNMTMSSMAVASSPATSNTGGSGGGGTEMSILASTPPPSSRMAHISAV